MKEYPAAQMMTLDGTGVILHDDKLLIRAQKSDIGLREGWKGGTKPVLEDGHYKIISWHNRDNVKVTVADKGGAPAVSEGERHMYLPQIERTVPMEGVKIAIKNNQLDIWLNDLQGDIRSRYLKSLDIMTEMVHRGVLSYRPRVESPTEKNVREAIRLRLKEHGKVAEYEHNLILVGKLGESIYRDLQSSDKAGGEYEGTIYLQGFHQYEGLRASQKFYDIGKRENAETIKLYKLETTFRKEYFKDRGLRNVNEFIEQPDIQEKLYIDLEKYIKKVLRKLSGETMKTLQKELQLTEKADVNDTVTAVLDRDLTLTERVKGLEKRMERVEKLLNTKEK